MTDSLTVFGTDFTGVTGIKATGTGNGTLTYIRPQGTKSISANGTGIDVAAYASVDVSVPTGVDVPSFEILWDSSYSSATVTCDKTFAECYALWLDGKSGAIYHASADSPEDTWEENGVLTQMGGDSTHIDYVANGNYGPTQDIVYNSDGTIDFVYPSSYAIELSVTQNGYYYPSSGVYTSVNVAVPSVQPTLQSKTATPSTSQQVIQPDSGYDGLSSVTVSAMPTGSATAPATINGTAATVSTGNNTLTLSKTVSVTPSVTAGYVSSGTAGNSSVSLTANVTTQAAQTIYPSTSDQSIAASRYLTGAQTIKGVAVANLTAENVKQGVTVTVGDSADADRIMSVTGTYSGGSSKNVQVAQSTTRSTSTSGTQVISLTCSTAGTYTVRWSTFRTSTSGTWGSRLYIGGTAYETMRTDGWSNHIQNREVTGVSISANQAVAVYVQSRGSNYYGYVGTLTIVQTS